MGQEADIDVVLNGQMGRAKALLEAEAIILRGGLKGRFALQRPVKVTLADETLTLTAGPEVLVLHLGARQAQRWADKITNPPSLLAKLGIVAGVHVLVSKVKDEDFEAALAAANIVPARRRAKGPYDVIIFGCDDADELTTALGALIPSLAPRGGLWVVSLKGKAATLKDVDAMRVAKSKGLVDNKVVSFSATHTALRFCRPR